MAKTGADNFWTLAKKRALPKETINYVPNILALTIIGKNPEKYGFNPQSAPPLEIERITVDKATDLRVIAEAINLPLEDLRELNTHVLRWTTPPDDPDFELILPKGYAEKFTAQIASLPESKRVLFREHVIRKGDTLGGIAKKYSSTVTDLRQANNLKSKTLLRVGQSLIIPVSGVAPAAVGVVRQAQARQRATSIDDRPGAPRSASAIARSLKNRALLQKPGTSYTVRRSDTLSKIAARFTVSVA
jgi:membrane-bound lytic murein transglycosylase D